MWNPLLMAIFNSYVKLPEGNENGISLISLMSLAMVGRTNGLVPLASLDSLSFQPVFNWPRFTSGRRLAQGIWSLWCFWGNIQCQYIYISFMYSTDCNPPKNRKVYKILLNEKVMNRFVSIFLGVPTGEVTTTSHDSIWARHWFGGSSMNCDISRGVVSVSGCQFLGILCPFWSGRKKHETMRHHDQPWDFWIFGVSVYPSFFWWFFGIHRSSRSSRSVLSSRTTGKVTTLEFFDPANLGSTAKT